MAISWTVGNPLSAVAAVGRLVKLNSGKMLFISGEVLAGEDNTGDTAVYSFDPTTDNWTTETPRNYKSIFFGATLLQNGKVLTAGGQSGGSTLNNCEIYDPVANTWTPTGSLGTARAGLVLVTLANGTVLAIGGKDIGSNTYFASCEIYDPVTTNWSVTGPLPEPKGYASVALLNDGRVLASGGDTNATTTGAQAATFSVNTWTAQNTGYVGTSSSFNGQNTAILSNGKVFNLAGGGQGTGSFTAYCESFDPLFNSWTHIADFPTVRAFAGCFTLPDDTILCVGGTTTGDVAQNDSWIYNPIANTWTQIANLNTARSYNYSAQGIIPLTNDNRVLMVGGRTNPNSQDILSSVETYDFVNSVSNGQSMFLVF